MSATLAPRSSLAVTPVSAGSQLCTTFALYALRKKAAEPQDMRASCSPQLSPLPLRNVSSVLSSSNHIDAGTLQAWGMK